MFFKSARRVRYHPNIKSIKKKCSQNAQFLKKKVDFCIFEPKNCEVIENSSKAPLIFSQFERTYLGKKSFQYYERLVRKK